MGESEEERRHRRHMRLQGYDYSQAGAYFVAICTQARVSLFGCIDAAGMKLSPTGQIVADEWVRTQAIRNNVALDEFIVMPNHMHAILMILEDRRVDAFPLRSPRETQQELSIGLNSRRPFRSPSQSVGSIVRGKSASTEPHSVAMSRPSTDCRGS